MKGAGVLLGNFPQSSYDLRENHGSILAEY